MSASLAQAIAQLQAKGPLPASPLSNCAPMDIFQQLTAELDSEGRYLLLNSLANQLRYPNSHTHYFSCVLLLLFQEATVEQVSAQARSGAAARSHGAASAPLLSTHTHIPRPLPSPPRRSRSRSRECWSSG